MTDEEKEIVAQTVAWCINRVRREAQDYGVAAEQVCEVLWSMQERLNGRSSERYEQLQAENRITALIDDLDLPARAYNCIQQNCTTVPELLGITARKMRCWKNCGVKTIAEIIVVLDRAGVKHNLRSQWWPQMKAAYNREVSGVSA